MDTMQRTWRRLRETWGPVLERLAAVGERALFRGIVTRLAIMLLGVGGLVLAISVIVERSVFIETTTERVYMLPPAPVVEKPAAPAPTVPSVVIPLPVEKRVVTSENVFHAIDRFDSAAHERITGKTEFTETAFLQSTSALTRAATEFFTKAASISGKPLVKASTALQEHARVASELVQAADNRRDMLKQYAALLDALRLKDKASLDKAWKIFGRVVTRQSLLQLSSDLDALLRTSAALAATDDDPAAATALLNAEATVRKDLDDNKDALQKSEGAPWYTAIQEDFAALTAMRESIDQADRQFAARMQVFSQQATELTRLVPSKVQTPDDPAQVAAAAAQKYHHLEVQHASGPSAPVPASPALAAASPAGATAEGRAAPTTVPSATTAERATTAPSTAVPAAASPVPAAASPAVTETREVSAPVERRNSKHDRLVWFCAGIVALLAYVAVGTALSIIRPVRQLVRAAARLAQGDGTVRVPRGGLKELDTVAAAFNKMAEQISSARRNALNYQESLERRVDERTRQLQNLAKDDPLTGLPNRRELFALLNGAIASAQGRSERLAVFFLDIDNFKYINDSMGHAFGDRVLVSLAQRLQEATRNIGLCARLGGDEFTVVFQGAPSSDAILEAGTCIVKAFEKPLNIDGRDVIVSVSVGASIYPDHERHSEGLLKAADAALFRAKALGRSQLSVFTPDLLKAVAGKFTVEQGLRRALERGEFELLFQPEISAAGLKTTLVEALIRWRTPDGKLRAPGEFLAVAEESGLIMQMGDWVLQSAVETAAHWHHGAWPEVRVAINVSPRQFIDAGFVDRLRDLLRRHRLPAHCIEIELTESVLQTGPATIEALKRLRAHGVAIALDDFGTGYSSLASLEQLPLTRIKLDRSLISGIDRSPRAAAVAHAIISMCQGLGLEITAEGVERPEQFSMLVEHRGMHLQGYLLARPTSRDELIPLLDVIGQRCHDLVLESTASASNEVNTAKPRLHLVSEAG